MGFGVWKIKQTCWHKNISLGDTALIKRLLDKGADINAKDNDFTLLMKAATEGYVKTSKLLIDKGAYIDVKTDEGSTALICAARAGYPKIVELLINAGANVKVKNNIGWTAEMYSKKEGYTEITQMLKLRSDIIDAERV
jgi:FOG: Ankyrin repeat